MLALICANDLGVLSIQPYGYTPKGVPKVDNTRFGATTGLKKNPIYFLFGAPSPKTPAEKLKSGPTGAPKIQACSRGLV